MKSDTISRILVVDDYRVIGELLKSMPGSQGYPAVIPNRPGETVHIILHRAIDPVILDQRNRGLQGTAKK